MSATTAAAPVRLGEYREDMPQTYRVPDEDRYIMELIGNDEPVQSKYQDKATGEYPYRVNLRIRIVSDLHGDLEFEGLECGKYVGIDLNPNDKTSIWHVLEAIDPGADHRALAGKSIAPYFNRPFVGDVDHTVKASTKRPGETVTYANVGAVKPAKKKKPAPVEIDEEPETPKKKRNPLLDDDEE